MLQPKVKQIEIEVTVRVRDSTGKIVGETAKTSFKQVGGLVLAERKRVADALISQSENTLRSLKEDYLDEATARAELYPCGQPR